MLVERVENESRTGRVTVQTNRGTVMLSAWDGAVSSYDDVLRAEKATVQRSTGLEDALSWAHVILGDEK